MAYSSEPGYEFLKVEPVLQDFYRLPEHISMLLLIGIIIPHWTLLILVPMVRN